MFADDNGGGGGYVCESWLKLLEDRRCTAGGGVIRGAVELKLVAGDRICVTGLSRVSPAANTEELVDLEWIDMTVSF